MRAQVFLCLSLVLGLSGRAAAQGLSLELSIGATIGTGWYDWDYRWYPDDTKISTIHGMDASVGATARWGVSIETPGLTPVLMVQGDLFSMNTHLERFLVSDSAGVLGARLPLAAGSLLMAGLFGLAFAATDVTGPGMTYGGCVVYTLGYLMLEARYQAFAFEIDTPVPALERIDMTLHQLILSVGASM